MRSLVLAVSLLLSAIPPAILPADLVAQQPSADTRPEPQVNPDRTVTFRVAAPGASAVSVSLEGTRTPIAMRRDTAGAHPELWTVTTPPLPPEFYSYHFEVDGRTLLDVRNPSVKASYTAIGNGFLVPGTPALPWETTAVPHGVVHHHTYTTAVVTGLEGNQSEFYVYTPPGYDPRGSTKYPVLYLLHGWSDTAGGWSTIGHANDILDNLIAAGKAKPMIVVMPLGYGEMSFVRSGFTVWNDRAAVLRNTGQFSQALLTEVLPQVEKLYNVSTRREDRAIAGLSMGGLESLTVGLTHTGQFAYIGGFSSAVHQMRPGDVAGYHPQTADLKLLWIACGTSDDLIEPNRKVIAALKSVGANVTPVETPGAHTWLVWRDNLIAFTSLLFR